MIEDYIQRFRTLRSDANRGKWSEITRHRAPHKPLLLLAVMDLIAEGKLTTNQIESTLELGELFTIYWSRVMSPDQRGNLALPFFHLQTERFWHLQAQPGKEVILAATPQIRSLSHLHELVRYAFFDEELYSLLCVAETRNTLRMVLIQTYFADEVQNLLNEQSGINVEAFQYSQALLEQARADELREGLESGDRYRPVVRDQAFRRAVVFAYAHRCAICGLRVLTADSHTAVDAAHIIPWSLTRNDDPRNGMALCKLCHWTFDEGLVSVSERYQVLTSPQLTANQNIPGHLITLKNRELIGPQDRLLWPDPEALHRHRTRKFRAR